MQRADLGGRRPHDERTWILLGDALAKSGDYGEARRVWKDGRVAFPASRPLSDRLAVAGDRALLEFVEDRRSLEQRVDTDLSFLDE